MHLRNHAGTQIRCEDRSQFTSCSKEQAESFTTSFKGKSLMRRQDARDKKARHETKVDRDRDNGKREAYYHGESVLRGLPRELCKKQAKRVPRWHR